ncbi:MAG: GNAT family N-acetyltransferase [Saprospiraceae bacterium]|jgi:ribosomal-protein-alanine N-acetyltransferase|nr:GNAT family N-acetyltransferase [Saprospiraceae bacterium]
MDFLFHTPRLSVRLLTMADLDFFFALQSDPEMMRYIRPPEPDREVIREKIVFLEKYAADFPGLGSVVAHWKGTDRLAASGVLRHIEYQPDNGLEIGYMVLRENWGQGLATEIARGLSDHAFAQLQAPKVTAFADPENGASHRVLEKAGFRMVGNRYIYETDNFEFVRERSDAE